MSSLFVLILAGGSGERFWPVSRRLRPKQLLSLFSERTLLEETVARMAGLVPPERIFVLTNADQVAAVRAVLPELPAANLIAEPAKRDTAAAIALGAALVTARDPDGVMAVLPADHVIRDQAGFQATLRAAVALADGSTSLVTIGIPPTFACPAFGYLELGEPDGAGAFRVTRFREKPTVELAEEFLAQGNFRWNAGMFVWSVKTITAAFAAHVPELAAFIAELAAAPNFDALMAQRFPTLPKISIDYAVLEKAAGVRMIEAQFDWDDVGSWAAVEKYWDKDAAGNSVKAPLSALGAAHNIVFSNTGQRIALLGVKDLIIVQTADALLICPRSEAENIKKLVSGLPPELQ